VKPHDKLLREMLTGIIEDTDNDLVVEILEWLENRTDGNTRKAAAALAMSLASLLSQTVDNIDQARICADAYTHHLHFVTLQMKHHELAQQREGHNDN
jgi:hypothetical protein